ncbi:hypothetical protein CKM354_001258100 [Cercospora kikuchii]|uniref:Uncharacterized protein n=1 Tax=Cercospora kikuchii TaxID=84275 RepID=A0A9P3FM96_9PEZI|nr:uncharacterized protein CKM354_001258100 [Cercospora kikuchii]GIZ49551.1 hypothetical protein CKM354_001258100 [Cercospora kikuchii]
MAHDSELSVANIASVAEGVLMSPRGPPSSVGASELGRLALGRPGSRDSEMVTTRSGAKREAASKGEKARSSAGPSKKKGQEKASSSKTTRKSGRTSKSAAAQDEPDDSDDDDDPDDSDESEDEGGGGVEQAVLKLALVNEPSHHCWAEFRSPDTKRSLESTIYRNLYIQHARKYRTAADLAPLMAVAPVEGRAWSDMMASKMWRRWHSILEEYLRYINPESAGGNDVDTTIENIRRLFHAVEDTLRQFPGMPDNAKQQLGGIFLQVFQTIPRYKDGTRPQGAPSYAGGSTQFEYNLLFRFAALKTSWLQCLEVLRRLHGAGYANLFQSRQEDWAGVHRGMYNLLGNAGWPRDSGEFITVLHRILTALGVVIAPIPTS